MALILNKDASPERRMKNVLVYIGSFDCDNSYPTGGYTVDGIHTRIKDMFIYQNSVLYEFVFDRANRKIKAYHQSTATPDQDKAEVANGVDLSGQTGVEYTALVYMD
jgi:hypothetical protein